MATKSEIKQKLIDDLPTLEGKKILIFGDVGVDEYVKGQVKRISPEAPVPVVEVESIQKVLGLSANVAANIIALGGSPILVSVVGEDADGEVIKALLQEKGIASDSLVSDPGRPTTSKLRVMSGQHHIVRVDYETKSEIDGNLLQKIKSQLEKWIPQCDGVIVQDYAKGIVSQASCQLVMELAKKHNKKVIVDPYRSTPLEYYQGAYLMTPNRDEAFDLAKQIPNHQVWGDVDKIGAQLMEKIQSEKMVITLGSEGMKIFNGGAPLHLPTFARGVFDVTGAGDTVISAFALAIAAEWSLEMSGYLANLAAGVVVAQVGAVACSAPDLKQYIQNHF
ncbi:MAG: D-glycero-beta-D-manno-heptose-7-phosphate kinase [Bdellovibrionales bacterium]|nr:D-glycero-beta-D-manno-heptose-7-phosphate kinase [Bdellovibrionales bacterium]